MMAKVCGEKLVYCFLTKKCTLVIPKNSLKTNMAASYVMVLAAPLRPQSRGLKAHISKKQAKAIISQAILF